MGNVNLIRTAIITMHLKFTWHEPARRLIKTAGLCALWIVTPDIVQSQTPLFQDQFENGVVANSDALTSCWTPSTDTYSTIIENNGKLTLTAGDTSSYGGVIAPRISSGSSQHEYNFFRRQLRFSAHVTITGNVASQSHLRFSLLGGASSAFAEEDVLSLILKADKTVSLSAKRDLPNSSVESATKLVNNVAMTGAITGFALTLDAVNYSLVVTYQGNPGVATFSGQHGLSAARWGIDGKSAMQFETVRSSSSGAGQITTATIDDFIVANMEPSGVFEDSFNNGIVADSNLESAVWSSTLPFTSTVTDFNGALLQTSTSAATDYILLTTTTPVQSRFNFFDRQLRIRATMSLTGSAATALIRSRLSLTSQTGSSTSANDAFVIATRADNYVTLVAKTDGPGSSPEDSSRPANKYLFNSNATDATLYLGSAKFSNIDLSINGTRYRLTGSYEDVLSGGNTRASNTSRFSGLHQLDRSKWGANGDSALMLESIRYLGATAGSTSITAWDNVRVDTDSRPILVEPFWTFTATYSTTSGTESGSFRVWLPSTEPVIRGILFIGPGDGSDYQYLVHDLATQEAARTMGFGLIGYTTSARMNLTGNDTAKIKAAVQEVLDRAAAVSGHPEISNAPVALAGFSRGSFDACYLVRNWPERVLAFVGFCGGEWSNPTLSATAKKVPGFFVPGSIDTNPATNPYLVQTMFNWWRNQGAQVAYCVNWNVGHNTGGNQGWEAMLSWMTEVARLRYPRPMAPDASAATFPTLLNLNDTSGWLADRTAFSSANTPSTTHVHTPIAAYSSYSGTVSTASWLPSETAARVYRAMTSTDLISRNAIPTHSPLRIATPALFAEPITAGTSVPIEIDPRDFDATNSIASVDFYDGNTWLGALTSGPLWRWAFTPTPGAHVLSVVATDVLGNKRDAFRLLNVIPANFAPMASAKTLAAYSNTPITGSASALDPEGNAVTYTIAQSPTHGTAAIDSATGQFTYRSTAGYIGSDTFTYTANDGTITSDPATVTLTVALGPVATISSLSATPGTTTGEINLSWSAADGATSYLIEASSNGGITYNTTATLSASTLAYTYIAPQWQSFLFRIKGFNATYSGSYSPVATATPYVAPTIDNWRLINFGSTGVIAGTSGDLDTPLDDGVSNLLRYALGYHLRSTDGTPLPLPPTNLPYVQEQSLDGASYLTCTFTRNKNATDLNILVEVTSDPSGPWTAIDPSLEANQVNRHDNTPSVGVETLVVKDTQPIGASAKRFMRVRVTRP